MPVLVPSYNGARKRANLVLTNGDLLQASTQSYNAAIESYNNGVRNLLDVTAAQRTLAQARSADVSARTQILTSLAELAFTTGDSIRTNNARPQP